MQIYFTDYFKKQLKKLKKKFSNVKDDLLEALDSINLQNEIHIGKGIYKVRIKSSDQDAGKSSGFRSYIYLYKKQNLLVPLCIYHKSKREGISDNELKYYFDQAIKDFLNG